MITVTAEGKQGLVQYFKDRTITPLRIFMRAS